MDEVVYIDGGMLYIMACKIILKRENDDEIYLIDEKKNKMLD